MQVSNNLEKIKEFHDRICEKQLEELKIQAHLKEEQWKVEKILHEYENESNKV